jgi:hypothetical protein
MFHVLGFVLILTIFAIGCSNISSSTKGKEAADDIMTTPGGPAYRANVQQEGEWNPWPRIQTQEVMMDQNVNVTYRANIDTKAGQARNNIVYVRTPGQAINTLNLNTSDVPAGMEVKYGMLWNGPQGVVAQVLIVDISNDVKKGQYSVDIEIILNGTNYGQIPCTIAVT